MRAMEIAPAASLDTGKEWEIARPIHAVNGSLGHFLKVRFKGEVGSDS